MQSNESMRLDTDLADVLEKAPSGRDGGTLQLEVGRGPDCLFVKLREDSEGSVEANGLSEALWALLEQHLVYRLVLDMKDVELLHSLLLGQLVTLRKRIVKCQGTLRLCGLSDVNQRVLHVHKLHGRLPHFVSKREAVMR